MVTERAVRDVLRTINDPEMPLSIVDLGIVEQVCVEAGRVRIDLLPTFVGCPALPVLEEQVRREVGALPGVAGVEVRFRFDPPWGVDRISPAGREALRQFGITVPQPDDAPGLHGPPPRCPFCGSDDVRRESAFGPTRCRMIYHCEACHNPFEHLKKLG